jgi:parafibromin
MTESTALQDLESSASSLSLSNISGKTITLNSQSYDFETPITFANADKTLTYSLISLFLQLQNPSISFVDYKKLCKEYDVKDFVKVTEKKHVLGYFSKGDEEKKVRIDAGGDSRAVSDEKRKPEKVKNRDSDREKGKSSHRDNKRSTKSKRSREDTDGGGSAKKKERKDEPNIPITHEQLLENLNIVVDKRAGGPEMNVDGDEDNTEGVLEESENKHVVDSQDGQGNLESTTPSLEDPPKLLSPEDEERRAIQACLSAKGYEATKLSQDILDKDRQDVEKITSFEIPVGDSGSILRCGALTSEISKSHGRQSGTADALNQRNFARVLDLFEEAKREEQHKHKHGSKYKPRQTKANTKEKVKPSGHPIIIVPNAMTSPITLMNSQPFFDKASFVAREKCQKPKDGTIEITRTVASRIGGKTITYEIMDNPKRHLKSPADWARVVGVIAQGESWQFKGWKIGWTDPKKKGGNDTPVEIFSHSFGFFVNFEGAPIPQELKGWNVKRGVLSRDKRGLDGVVYSQFWNGLDEWMFVHKRELLSTL